ncbi:MAG: SAM-dependent methyltransferase [Saprospirales bacterium]|nr:SAM-dependent methyltransferase [Saprospirales bacterium]
MNELNPEYWNRRYLNNDIPWDAGAVTTPIKAIIDSLQDRDLKILVPGAGSGHEVAYLISKGFKNVTVCEWAPAAAGRLLSRVPELAKDQVLVEDFFLLNGSFDLILEQTFFCALPRNRREDYVQKVYELLVPGGALRGVLFSVEFPFDRPPFGGSRDEYLRLFSGKFEIRILETCKNSIPPRSGNELEIYFVKC